MGGGISAANAAVPPATLNATTHANHFMTTPPDLSCPLSRASRPPHLFPIYRSSPPNTVAELQRVVERTRLNRVDQRRLNSELSSVSSLQEHCGSPQDRAAKVPTPALRSRATHRPLAFFPTGLVRRPDGTRCRGRIGIAFGRGLAGQTSEQATALAKGDGTLAGPEGFSPFFVEDAECC